MRVVQYFSTAGKHGDLLIVESFLDDGFLPLTILTPAHPHSTQLMVRQREVNKTRVLKADTIYTNIRKLIVDKPLNIHVHVE